MIAVRPALGLRHALLDNQSSIHHLNAATDQRVLTTSAELREMLSSAFQVRLPEEQELEAVLTRVPAVTP